MGTQFGEMFTSGVLQFHVTGRTVPGAESSLTSQRAASDTAVAMWLSAGLEGCSAAAPAAGPSSGSSNGYSLVLIPARLVRADSSAASVQVSSKRQLLRWVQRGQKASLAGTAAGMPPLPGT